MAITAEQVKTLTPEQQQRVAGLLKAGGATGKTQALQLAEDLYGMNQKGQTTVQSAPVASITPAAPIKPVVTTQVAPVKPVVTTPAVTTITTEQGQTLTPEQQSRVLSLGKTNRELAKKMATDLYNENQKNVIKATAGTGEAKKNIPLKEQVYKVPGTDLTLPTIRAQEIARNLEAERTTNPSSFETREKYNAWSGYDRKTPAEQKLVDQFWQEKMQPEIDKKNAEQIKTAQMKLEDPNLMKSATEQDIALTKQQELIAQHTKELQDSIDKQNKGLAVISQNSKDLRNLYGIKDDGSVDMENKNGFAYKMNSELENFKAQKNALLAGQESAQLNQVQGTMRSMMASRGYTANNVPPEVLIGLSGQLGIDVLSNIGKIRSDTVNSILQQEQNVNSQIMQLREKGVIDNNQARTASETLRSTTEDLKNSIDKQFKSDMLGVAEAETARKTMNKKEVLNAVTQFGTSIGLTGQTMGILSNYLTQYSTPQEAVAAMTRDLQDKNSVLGSTIAKIDKDKLEAALSAAQTKQTLAESQLTKAQKTGTAKSTEYKLSDANRTLTSGFLGKPIQDVTMDDFNKAMESISFRKLISKDTFVANRDEGLPDNTSKNQNTVKTETGVGPNLEILYSDGTKMDAVANLPNGDIKYSDGTVLRPAKGKDGTTTYSKIGQ